MLRHDTAAIIFEIKCARSVMIKTYLEEQYMAVRLGGGFIAPSCFLEQTRDAHIEFF